MNETFSKYAAIAIFLVAAALATAGIWIYRDQNTSLLDPADPILVARGGEIYSLTCASCHGANLEGEENWRSRREDGLMPAPPHDETGHTWHHADQLLFDLTKRGLQAMLGGDYRTNMPAYRGVLKDDEIVVVLSFIKSKWPQEIQDRHDQINAASRRK